MLHCSRIRIVLLLTLAALACLGTACGGESTPEVIVVTTTHEENVTLVSAEPGETLLEEDFDDEIADGWRTDGGTWGINQGEYDQANTTDGPTWSTYTGLVAGDYSVEAGFKLLIENYAANSSRTGSLALRMADTDNFYLAALSWRDNTLTLYSVVDGNWETLASRDQALEPATWYTLHVAARGPFLRVYVNDVQQIEVSNGDHSAGYTGLRVNGGHFRMDNIHIVALSTPSTSDTQIPFDDDFDDGDSDGWWKLDGQWRTVEGALTQYGDVPGGAWIYQPHCSISDYRVEARVQGGNPDSAAGLAVRVNGRSDGYIGVIDRSARELRIWVHSQGDWTKLSSRPLPADFDAEAWHTLEFEAAGQTLLLTLDDTLPLEVSDDIHREGCFGAWLRDTTARFDDFQVETVEVPSHTDNTLPFTDNFNDDYADGWLGKQNGGWSVIDDALDQGQFTLGTSTTSWVDVNAANYAVSARVRLMPEAYTNDHARVIGLMIRRVADDKAYVASINLNDGVARFWYGDGVNWHPLSGDVTITTFDMDDWNTLRVEAFEDQLRFRLNGDLVFSASDNQITTGGFGVRIREGHFQIDDVRAEEIDR